MSTLPITVPNTFATATVAIPLSSLDANFTTVTTALNGIGDGTTSLANLTATGGNVTLTTATVATGNITQVNSTNASVTGTATIGTASITTANVGQVNATNATITGATSTGSAAVTGTLTAATVTASGTVTGNNVTATNTVTAGNASITSGISAASVTASGNISAANVTASSTVTAVNASVTGTATINNANFTGTVTGLTVNLNAVTAINNGPIAGFRNRIINGNFQVNQRAYASGTNITTSGTYTFDRWRTSGTNTTLTFSTTVPDVSVTINAAGILQQVVETVNVEGGVYTLSWAGTATARVAINGTSPSGSYAASPITTSSANAGQAITVEFINGTLGKVQLEPGSTASTFERRPLGVELGLCYRYFYAPTSGSKTFSWYGEVAGRGTPIWYSFPVTMRATPTATTAVSATANCGSTTITVSSSDVFVFIPTAGTGGAQATLTLGTFSAEL
jgi:hypothetical protein